MINEKDSQNFAIWLLMVKSIRLSLNIKTDLHDFKELNSFVKVGKKYNVSDNGIRRWCEHYNLPTSKKYLLEYINRRIV